MRQKLTLALCALLICGCSREGFQSQTPSESISQSVVQQPVSTQKPLERELSVVEKEHSTAQLQIRYTELESNLPTDAAAQSVNETLFEICLSTEDYFDLSDPKSSVTLRGEVTKSDGDTFSQLFVGSYQNPMLDEPATFAFGLSFNLATGEQLAIDAFLPADELSAILYNEGRAKLLETDKSRYDLVQTEVNQMGQTMIEHRIIAANAQQSLDHLNTFSYYLKNDLFIAIVPLSAEAGYLGYFEIPLIGE